MRLLAPSSSTSAKSDGASSLRPSFCLHSNHHSAPPHLLSRFATNGNISTEVVRSFVLHIYSATKSAHHGQRQKVCLLWKYTCATNSPSVVVLLRHVTYMTSMQKLASISSSPATDHHTADRSISRLRTDMVAVVSPTALEDARLAQTPTALALLRQLAAPMFLPVDAAVALLLVETPTADARLRRETGTKHPEAATATVPDLALRFL